MPNNVDSEGSIFSSSSFGDCGPQGVPPACLFSSSFSDISSNIFGGLKDCNTPNIGPVSNTNHVTSETTNIRSVILSDFMWLDKSATIQNVTKPDVFCGNILYFVPPRHILAASAMGNAAYPDRFNYFKNILHDYRDDFKSLTTISPGLRCIVRSNSELARGVILSQLSENEVLLALLDNYYTFAAPLSQLYEIPDIFNTENIPCNLFIAQIHGVTNVVGGLQAYEAINEMISTIFNSAPVLPIAGIVVPQVNGECTADMGILATNKWFSQMLNSNYISREPTVGALDFAEHYKLVNIRFDEGYYAFEENKHGVPANIKNYFDANNIRSMIFDGGKKEEASPSANIEFHVQSEDNHSNVNNHSVSSFSHLADFVEDTLEWAPMSSHKAILHGSLSLMYFIKSQLSETEYGNLEDRLDDAIDRLMRHM